MSLSSKIKACIFLLFMVMIYSCKQIRKVTDVIVQPTARELYAREFENLDSLRFNSWQQPIVFKYAFLMPSKVNILKIALQFIVIICT